MDPQANKKPVDYLKKNRTIISSGIVYFDHVKRGLPRTGWNPHTPQHFIYQQRINSAQNRRRPESSVELPPGLARPRTAHVLPSIHTSLISLNQNDGPSVDLGERPTSSNLFFSTTKVKHVQLPQTLTRSRSTLTSAAGYRAVSVCSERYLQSTPSPSLPGKKADSEQARRFEDEWANKEKSRLLKRLSETREYRVDRLYYINGMPCPRLQKPSNHERDRTRRLKHITNGSALRIPQTQYRPEDDVPDAPDVTPRQPPSNSNGVTDETPVTSAVTSAEPVFMTQPEPEVTSDRLELGQQIDVTEAQSVVLEDNSSDDDSIDDVPNVAVKINKRSPNGSPECTNGNPDEIDQSEATIAMKTDQSATVVAEDQKSDSQNVESESQNNGIVNDSQSIADSLAKVDVKDSETEGTVEDEYELALKEAFDEDVMDDPEHNDEEEIENKQEAN